MRQPRSAGGRLAGAALIAGLLMAGIAIIGGLFLLPAHAPGFYLVAGGLALGATLVWSKLTVDAARDSQLRRLANALEAALASRSGGLPPVDRNEHDPLVTRLHQALAAILSQRDGSGSEARLSAILAALPHAIIVINDMGLVTLVNQPAIDLFGREQLKPGTSVFDAIDRDSLGELRRKATTESGTTGEIKLIDGGTRSARVRELTGHAGAVIAIDDAPDAASGVLHELELHEPSPPRVAPTPATPLDELSVLVLDCETTGLNVGLDRILSIGAVRVQGTRILRFETIDFLVDPGEPVAPASTAIHGITDAMVWGERSLAERWPEFEPALRDCVLVGHNVGFDLTILEIELRRAGIRWIRPPSLCTLQLAAALEPDLSNLNLEALAEAYGIEVSGRHTALGDALVTAEIYIRLVAIMRQRGDLTLAQAQARAATARRVIRQQQAAGW